MEKVDTAHEKYAKLANERDNILASLNGYIARINITSSEKQAENYYKKAQQLLEKYKILARKSHYAFNEYYKEFIRYQGVNK
jgi:hypothetical protein